MKKKPIQPTASLETVRKMMEERKKGNHYSNPYHQTITPNPLSGLNIIYDDEEWAEKKGKNAERKKAIANRQEIDREISSRLNQASEDLYNKMLEFYNKTKDVDATIKNFEQEKSFIQECTDKLSYNYTFELSPYERIITKMCLIDGKFLNYLSDSAIITASKTIFNKKHFIEKNNEYLYNRLGENVMTFSSNLIRYFPQLIGRLDLNNAQNMLLIYPNLYGKLSEATHKDLINLKDADGKHVALLYLIKYKVEIVKYLPEEDLTLALIDFPITIGRALNTFPQKILDLKSGIFSTVPPKIVFQGVSKQEMVNNLIKADEENNTDLYSQIITKHPQLADYFAKFISKNEVSI